MKSSIFCDKTQHILKVWRKSHWGKTKLRSWEKWEVAANSQVHMEKTTYLLICWAFFFLMIFWSWKTSDKYVDPKVDDNEVKGWCLDEKSRTILVKMSASKKGFISHESILIIDWNCAHLKINSGAGVKMCISERYCNFRKGRYT